MTDPQESTDDDISDEVKTIDDLFPAPQAQPVGECEQRDHDRKYATDLAAALRTLTDRPTPIALNSPVETYLGTVHVDEIPAVGDILKHHDRQYCVVEISPILTDSGFAIYYDAIVRPLDRIDYHLTGGGGSRD